LLSIYALLPEHYRFSRGIVVVGALTAFVAISLQRWALTKGGILQEPFDASSKPHILIAANGKEFSDAKKFLAEKGFASRIIGRVGINGATENVIAHINEIDTTAKALNAKELIFCARTLSYKALIALTEKYHSSGLKFRYHACSSSSIVGSDTSTESGEILSDETAFNLEKASNRRLKRLIDIAASLLLLLSFPLHFFFVEKPIRFFANCFTALAGIKTWVGYINGKPSLPALRKSVLAPNGRKELTGKLSANNSHLLDYWYARNYEPAQDVKTILSHYKYLGS
jgi:hypothetical protein